MDTAEEIIEVPVPPKAPAPTVTLDDEDGAAMGEFGDGGATAGEKEEARWQKGRLSDGGGGDESWQENQEESAQQSKLSVLRLLSEQVSGFMFPAHAASTRGVTGWPWPGLARAPIT